LEVQKGRQGASFKDTNNPNHKSNPSWERNSGGKKKREKVSMGTPTLKRRGNAHQKAYPPATGLQKQSERKETKSKKGDSKDHFSEKGRKTR